MLYVHIIAPINARTNVEINQYNIDEFRKYTKIVFHLMSRDIVRHSHTAHIYIYPSGTFCNAEVSTTSGSKVRTQSFYVFGDLDIDR